MGAEMRRIPLNATVRRAINAYLSTRGDRSPKDSLFLTKRDQSASVRTLQQTITVLAQRAKIDRIKVSANTLRHTFVHNYLKIHPDEFEVLAEILGHASPNSVTVYSRPEAKSHDEKRLKIKHSRRTSFTSSPSVALLSCQQSPRERTWPSSGPCRRLTRKECSTIGAMITGFGTGKTTIQSQTRPWPRHPRC